MTTGHLDATRLAEHAEGMLGAREAAAVEAHLRECEVCRATAADLGSVSALLAAAPSTLRTPAHVVARLDRALAEEVTSTPEPAPVIQLSWFRRKAPQLLAAAATVGVLGFAGWVVANGGGGDDGGNGADDDAGAGAPGDAARDDAAGASSGGTDDTGTGDRSTGPASPVTRVRRLVVQARTDGRISARGVEEIEKRIAEVVKQGREDKPDKAREQVGKLREKLDQLVEDDVLITEHGNEVLTAALARDPSAVEEAVRG